MCDQLNFNDSRIEQLDPGEPVGLRAGALSPSDWLRAGEENKKAMDGDISWLPPVSLNSNQGDNHVTEGDDESDSLLQVGLLEKGT